jgi:murein DD-endopeptidase MepM/ murein hydrolase activator NlpD
MAPTGTAEYAVTDGTIVYVAGADENGWNSLGGYAVMLKAAYSVGPIKQGDLFYYAHLNRESALEIGTKVQVGQTLAVMWGTRARDRRLRAVSSHRT